MLVVRFLVCGLCARTSARTCILCVNKILRSCREIWRKGAMLIDAWQCQVFFVLIEFSGMFSLRLCF